MVTDRGIQELSCSYAILAYDTELLAKALSIHLSPSRKCNIHWMESRVTTYCPTLRLTATHWSRQCRHTSLAAGQRYRYQY